MQTGEIPVCPVSSWRRLLADSIVTPEVLAKTLPVSVDELRRVTDRYPLRITPYFLSLVHEKNDPLWRQCVPDIRELETHEAFGPDSLGEESQSPVPGLIHRHSDRVLFLVSNRCAMYCRHCMRKRRAGEAGVNPEPGLAYIRSHAGVREVILSGGDPLMLEDDRLEYLLNRLHGMPHIKTIRIHTRMPGVLPQRVTERLAALLRRFSPLYVNIQFNHPLEITPEAEEACGLLADAGIPLGSQTVLLKGVNDDPAVMLGLMRRLLEIRVRPYYLHHGDPIAGTRHFRTSIKTGLQIMDHLRGRLSGMGVPYYMIDLPGGGGKIPLLPEYIENRKNGVLTVRNVEGKTYPYPDG